MNAVEATEPLFHLMNGDLSLAYQTRFLLPHNGAQPDFIGNWYAVRVVSLNAADVCLQVPPTPGPTTAMKSMSLRPSR